MWQEQAATSEGAGLPERPALELDTRRPVLAAPAEDKAQEDRHPAPAEHRVPADKPGEATGRARRRPLRRRVPRRQRVVGSEAAEHPFEQRL